MNIRESQPSDFHSIRAVHDNAFGEPEGKVVAQLACDILTDETAKPLLSLVAEENGGIVGHIIFSPVKIEGSEAISAYILAPLAVAKSCQQQGVGTALLHSGLEAMKKQGVDIVMVLGDPNYYTRAGFKAGHNIKAPYTLPYPEAWMALELTPGTLDKAKGTALCASSLASPEHW